LKLNRNLKIDMKKLKSVLSETFCRQSACVPAGFILLALTVLPAQAQIDPVPRQLLHLGADVSLRDQGPFGAYAFYYWNMPNVPTTNEVLRLAIAPVYVDGDLGFQGLLGKQTDLAVGAFGGLFANSYQEVDGGLYQKDQSFNGNNVGARVSLYHRVNPDQMIPLTLVLRETVNYVDYSRNDTTADKNDPTGTFALPNDQPILTTRAGFRWGGKEPVLTPKLAGEVSGWYEWDHRTESGNYGFAGNPYQLNPNTQRIFGRILANYLTIESQQYITFSLQGGWDVDADRLGCFRLGGMLPYTKEFPLLLPGYFYQELSAKSFGLANVTYGIPIDKGDHWYWLNTGGAALVDYVEGTGQPGAFNSGVGTGIGYNAPSHRWKLYSMLGYGFEAHRIGGQGGYSFGLAFQYNFGHTMSDSDKAYRQLEDHVLGDEGTSAQGVGR
jgi:hypothetical protein